MQVEYSIESILYWVRCILIEEDISNGYGTVYSILVYVVSELLVFTGGFSYSHIVQPTSLLEQTLSSVGLGISSASQCALGNGTVMLCLDTDTLVTTSQGEILYTMVNVHGMHMCLGSTLWNKGYWVFVDGLWYYILHSYYA